jgi:hypothetical protein
MKHLFNDISSEEKNRILEMHKKSDNFENITEQSNVQFASVFPNVNVLKSVKDTLLQVKPNTNLIYLSRRNPKTGQPIPNTTFTYEVTGSYSILRIPYNFKVQLKNFQRSSNGVLSLEARPDNKIVFSAMKNLIPKENLTQDQWLKVSVDPKKLNTGLDYLFRNKGTTARIDAGNGVSIILKQYGV